jgi:2-polyprenyl-6-methoxyphenol hydroxylase-like FAD-dependent oxidoreductase
MIYDVVVVGAGPAGLSFAWALHDQSQTSADFLGYMVANNLTHRAAYDAVRDCPIARLFTDDCLTTKLVRRTLLRLGNHLPPARRAILNQLTEIPNLNSAAR